MPRRTRRTKYEIWSEILDLCTRKSQTKTNLKRNLGVKTSTLSEALDFLLQRKLIEIDNDYGDILYLTTKNGEEALKQYYLLITEFFVSEKNKK